MSEQEALMDDLLRREMRGGVQILAHDTWLEAEEFAYPNGGQTRKARAIYPDGVRRRVMVGIPDTWFTIPAHGRLDGKYVKGWVQVDDDLDSPTRGALMFHIRSKP